MNDTPITETIQTGAEAMAADAAAAVQDTATAAQDTASSIASELKEFGVRIAAVAQAAVNTPEAQELRNDVIDGIRQLREQFDGMLETLRNARAKAAENGEGGTGNKLGSQVRTEAATLLRTMNRGLEKLAGTIQPSDSGSAPSETAAAPTDAPSGQA
jgi:hypothetical protein